MKKVKRVLFCHQTGALGGGAISMFSLIDSLDNDLFIKPILLFSSKGNAVKQAKKRGLDVIIENTANISSTVHVPVRIGMLFNFLINVIPSIVKVMRIIKKEKIDLVYINSSSGSIIAIAAWLKKKKIIWHVREVLNKSSFVGFSIIKLIENISDKIINNSFFTGSVFKPSHKIHVIYNAIEFHNYLPLNEDKKIRLKQELNISAEKLLIAIFAVVGPSKGIKVALDAVAKVKKKIPNIHLVLVGDSSIPKGYENSFRAKIRNILGIQYQSLDYYKNYAMEIGIDDSVSFTGWRDDVGNLMHLIKILVLPSLYPEGFGRTIIEAGACGKPVISTNIGGPAEIIDDGINGYLVPPNDSDALSKSISNLIIDDKKMAEMGNNNYVRTKEKFSIDDYRKKIFNLIQSEV